MEKETTERKKAEDALKESKDTLKLAQEVANIGSWVWDINTDKLTWSQKVYEIFGFDTAKSPLLYKDFINCLHQKDLEFVTRSIEDSVKKQIDFDVEYRIIRPVDKVEKVIHAKGKAFYDDKDKPVRMLGMVFDITEQKRLEKELQKMQNLESIGNLAGGIAHDFNNILSGIINNIYLSKMYVKHDSKAYENLKSAEKAIHRATNLTQQLLTFSRGGAPVKKAASLTEIIRESTEFILNGSNVTCEYHIADNLRQIEVDEGQISQSIQNLILNASQSMPEGGKIRISIDNIELTRETGFPLHEGSYLKIAIQDEGTGISKENLKNAFDPYFTTKDMGRGLGLSLTYSIIKNHDGHISVESDIGSGTTLTIYLPASENQIEENESEEDIFILGQGKILLMDDEEIIRESIGSFLTVSGYEIMYANNGEEAVDLYHKEMKTSNPFDAVILDLTIRGGTGGKEAIKKLLEIDPNVKAIVSSGYSNDPVMAKFREYGFRAVLAKPCRSQEELRAILQKVLKGQ